MATPASTVTLVDGTVGLVEWTNESKKSVVCVRNDGQLCVEVPVWSIRKYCDVPSPMLDVTAVAVLVSVSVLLAQIVNLCFQRQREEHGTVGPRCK